MSKEFHTGLAKPLQEIATDGENTHTHSVLLYVPSGHVGSVRLQKPNLSKNDIDLKQTMKKHGGGAPLVQYTTAHADITCIAPSSGGWKNTPPETPMFETAPFRGVSFGCFFGGIIRVFLGCLFTMPSPTGKVDRGVC